MLPQSAFARRVEDRYRANILWVERCHEEINPGQTRTIACGVTRGILENSWRICWSLIKHSDLHGPAFVCTRAHTEEGTIWTSEHPVAAIGTRCGWRDHLNGNINGLTRCNTDRQQCEAWSTELFSVSIYNGIRLCPCTGTNVHKTPGLGKSLARKHHGSRRDCHIGNEFRLITKTRWSSIGAVAVGVFVCVEVAVSVGDGVAVASWTVRHCDASSFCIRGCWCLCSSRVWRLEKV